jgi:hypothetical protein
MKKSLFAVVALVFATSALAEGNYAGIKLETRDGRASTADSNVFSMTVGKSINQYLNAEVYTRLKNEDGTDSNNTRLEGALIGSVATPVNGLSVYTRGAMGKRFDHTSDYNYWSVEPGVKYAVTGDLALKAGVRFRDAFNDANNDSTRTYRLGAEYALDKTQTLSVGFDRSLGNAEFNAFSAGYGIKF